MRIHPKSPLGVALALVAITGLAACGDKKNDDSDTSTDTAADPIDDGTDTAGDTATDTVTDTGDDTPADTATDGDAPADTPSDDAAADVDPGTCVGDDLWFDPHSGLCWQNSDTIPMDSVATGITTCADLTLGGFDWEMPTIDQLRSLIRYETCTTDCGCSANLPGGACGVTDPACLATTCNSECGACTYGEGPEAAYGCYFAPDMSGTCMGAPHWSRSAVSDDATRTWQIDFSNASVLTRPSENYGYLRCVRIED